MSHWHGLSVYTAQLLFLLDRIEISGSLWPTLVTLTHKGYIVRSDIPKSAQVDYLKIIKEQGNSRNKQNTKLCRHKTERNRE